MDAEMKARELLASEYERDGNKLMAADLRAGVVFGGIPRIALRAVRRALEQPASDSARERWNIDRDGDGLLVCFNNHAKSEGCHYVRYVPEPWQPASAAGFVMVPNNPTPEQLAAMSECYDPTWGYCDDSIGLEWAQKSYAAMLAVAPKQGNEK